MLRTIFGPLFAVLLFAMGFVVGSSPHSVGSTESQTAAKTSEKADYYDPYRALRDWFSKDASGFFTFWLVMIGGSQVALFYWQLRLIRESLAPAQTAARAAQAAAEYIPVVEGAYVYVLVDEFSRAQIDDIKGQEITDPPAVKISLKNFGKTPAFIHRVVARLNCVPIVNGDFERFFVPPETLIGAGETTNYGETIALKKSLSPLEAFRIGKHSAHIILEGQLVYADILGKKWTVPFTGRYDADTKRFSVAHEPRQQAD
jgi:hypothetical protein